MTENSRRAHGRLRLPRLLVYRTANRQWWAGWNEYVCGGRIGYAVQVGGWCISLRWRHA